jgi:hypothetical protein
MGSERVLDVAVRRHVFDSQLPFQAVLDGIFGGIGLLRQVTRTT